MAERKCSDRCRSRFSSYFWVFLGFLHRFVKAALWPILENVGLSQRKYPRITYTIRSPGITSYAITKNMQFLSQDNTKLEFDPATFKLVNPTGKPLCLLITWLFAEQKHIDKYTEIYIEQGFDVVAVTALPWQAMWPARGSQLLARDVLKFLHVNDSVSPILLHGFSVAAYMWGEVTVHMSADMDKYQHVVDRIVLQVWDSVTSFTESVTGFPVAIFPKSKIMQNILKYYFKFHMLVFHGVTMVPFMRASDLYHHMPCPAPALLLGSANDPIGTETAMNNVRDAYTSHGVKVTLKCWDESPHVRHYAKHPKEYLTLLYNHMETAGLLQHKDKMRARLSAL